MRYFSLILLVFISLSNSFSQEITDENIPEDSLYYDDDYYYEEEPEEEYSGYIAFTGIQFKHQVIKRPEKFDYTPIGFSFGLYKQINENLPFFLGGNIGLDTYGKNSYEYFDYGFEDGYEYQFSDDFTAHIVDIGIGGKYFSDRSFWIFNPFVQLDMEYRYAFGYVNTVNLDLDETVNTEYEKGNSGFGYNLGLGSLIDIDSDGLFLYFSLNYTSGGGLFLYDKRQGEYEVFSVMDYYDYKYFPIGFITFKAGLSFSK